MKWSLSIRHGLVMEWNQGVSFALCFVFDKTYFHINISWHELGLSAFELDRMHYLQSCRLLQHRNNTCPHDLIQRLRADTVLCCKKDMLCRLLLSKQVFLLPWKIRMFHLICSYHRKEEIPHWNSVYALCFSLRISYFFFGCYITVSIASLILHCLFL